MTVNIKFFIYLYLIIGVVLSKFFYNEWNVHGTSSYVAYLLEYFVLFIITIVYFKNIYTHKFNMLEFFWICFYSFALLISFYSVDPLNSAHHSIKGLLYVVFGLLISHYVEIKSYSKQLFIQLIHVFFIFGMIGSLVQLSMLISFRHLLDFGGAGSFYALMGLFSLYWQLLFLSKSKSIFRYFLKLIVIMVTIGSIIILNSFSSIVNFFIAYILVLFIEKRFIKFILIGSILSIVGYFVYLQLADGLIMIANKNLDTLLSGSARFEVWKFCIDKIFNLDIDMFGYGFMADGYILKNQNFPIDHTCHNSFLSAIVGLGIFGFLFYMWLLIIIILNVVKSRNDKTDEGTFIKLSLVSIMLFGIGSPMFPGAATFLVPLSMFIYKYYNSKKGN